MSINKRLTATLALCFCIFCSLRAQENLSFFRHTVEKGQTLYSIAKMYHVSVSEITALNSGSEKAIFAGEVLKIPRKGADKTKETFHTIQPGETLYRLTVIYQITAEAIIESNPGLSAKNFRAGQVIKIPAGHEQAPAGKPATTEASATKTPEQGAGKVQARCREMHKVKWLETIYSISRRYGITEEELTNANPEIKNGLKRGQYLCIPYTKDVTVQTVKEKSPTQQPVPDEVLFARNKDAAKKLNPLKVAIVLPFTADARMVEYYEGMLLAVDSLKKAGVSMDIHAYNCTEGAETLKAIIDKPEMRQMDVVFGPMYQQQIKPLSEFAKKHRIRLVVPFSSKGEEELDNPLLYRINTPQSYLYSEVYERFIGQFRGANVIFVSAGKTDTSKAAFVKGLRKELADKSFSTHTVDATASVKELKSNLKPGMRNVFVPESGSETLLNQLLPQLTQVAKEETATPISLFGYPEWQTYTRRFLENFFLTDTYFYSSFYTNTLFPEAVAFSKNYFRWYAKDPMGKYPSYAMLGFDTGYYFLKGLAQYGSEFEQHLDHVQVTPVQTGFAFKRVNNWGGFINKKVFLVHFTKNFQLTKLEFD